MDAWRPRIVLAHDWLTGMRGGEKCLEALCDRWPDAPLYTLLQKPNSFSSTIQRNPIRASPLNWLPQVWRYYRYLLPLMPFAAETWRTPPCDLVVSFSHCVAKSIRPPRDVPHVCYCFTPMRYAWHMRRSYFERGRMAALKGWAVDQVMGLLRTYDRAMAARVSHFIAISRTVQDRIRECYDRDSVVIYPPVDTDFYRPDGSPRENYYLILSAFAPYKRVDLAIEACNRLQVPLVIIGTGQDEARLKALAGPTVRFLGWQPDSVLRDHLCRCRALIFPGEEDFGIVPVEAMACGTPVIAYGRGGATETVIPVGTRQEPTGLWFTEQTVESLSATLEQFERCAADFSPEVARQQALRFDQRRFQAELFGYLDEVLGVAEQTQRAA